MPEFTSWLSVVRRDVPEVPVWVSCTGLSIGDEAKMRLASWLCVVPILSPLVSASVRIYSALFSKSFWIIRISAHLTSDLILS
jgi:hypothetical protein